MNSLGVTEKVPDTKFHSKEKLPQLPHVLNHEKTTNSATKGDSDFTKPTQKPALSATNKAIPIQKQKSETGELEEAATKIQAVFRGHKTRKTMKKADNPEKNAEATEDLANEFRPDDPELCNAATKIQASFRGHMARKKITGKEGEDGDKQEGDAAKKVEEEEEFDIDLADPDLNKAASRIQATFRTHMKHKDE